MRERQSAARVLDHQRLAVLERGRAGGGITIVADSGGALEAIDHVAVEDVGDETHPAMRDQRLAVGRDDSGGFLSAMLQRIHPQVGEIGGLGMAEDAEDAAFLVEGVEVGLLGRDFDKKLLREFSLPDLASQLLAQYLAEGPRRKIWQDVLRQDFIHLRQASAQSPVRGFASTRARPRRSPLQLSTAARLTRVRSR